MILTGINRSRRRHAVLFTDPTWTDMGSNLDFCSKKPMYIHLKLDCGLSLVACAVPDNSWQYVSSDSVELSFVMFAVSRIVAQVSIQML